MVPDFIDVARHTLMDVKMIHLIIDGAIRFKEAKRCDTVRYRADHVSRRFLALE